MGKELEVELFMNCNKIDIVCITEHWLKDHQIMFGFKNHQVASSFCRVNAVHGGSIVLIRNNIKFKERCDIVKLSVERTIEIACIELERLIILSVYRPPASSYEMFENIIDEALSKLCNSNKNIIVCGDFNINLLDDCGRSNSLINLFKCFNLSNLFLVPTRITHNTATCIDNIFTDLIPNESSIINKLPSDHCGQLASFNIVTNKLLRKDISYVPVNENRLKIYRNNVMSKLIELEYHEDVNQLYNSLFNTINSEYNIVFKPKKMQVSSSLKFSDWATVGIHKSRQKLYELYEEKTYNHSEQFIQYTRNYSKMFKRVCSLAKSNYIKNQIINSTNVTKMTWKIINGEIGKVKTRNSDIRLIINNKMTNTDQEVANAFELFFTNIPVTTTKSLNSSPALAESLLLNHSVKCENYFEFSHVSYKDILKVFKSLQMKKTADLYGLSVAIINSIVDCIAPHLAYIFNKCIDGGVFPDLMKESKVIPLFKSGSTTDPTNFRPISILPTLSKIFEKIILNQLLAHFSANNIMSKKQFGFTRERSTTDAGIYLINTIFDAWEESRDAVGVFCDLSKAFDCVRHDILIRKLQHYGIAGLALDLLKSYLCGRVQKVDVNGTRSSGSVVNMGVPQGSILGPFMFLTYINDLPDLVGDTNEIVLFADDTSLLFKIKRQQSSYDDVNSAISGVVAWFESNNLLLNEKKTNVIKFILPNVRQVDTNVLVKSEKLETVKTAVFLGITLDTQLQWGPHISKLANRLSSAAYAVGKIRNLSDIETARLVYFSYFHSLMSYGIILWGNAADREKIFILQKRAVRAIYKLGPRESLRDKFKEINILTFASQYIYENILYVKKNISSFKKNSDVHNINTRHKDKLAVLVTRLHKVNNSYKGLCIRFYNKIPVDIQNLPLQKFKSIIKQKLYKKGYYRICDYLEDKNPWT